MWRMQRCVMDRRAFSIVAEIREAISTGRVDDGALIGSETQLLDVFAASRATLREALRLLEMQGFVVVRRGPGGGIFARRPQPHDLAAAIRAHLLVHGGAATEVSSTAALIGALAQLPGYADNRVLQALNEAMQVLAPTRVIGIDRAA
jgi:DNA-binding FadR family transcriptional regulator